MSAAQMTDGTWRAWGRSEKLVKQTKMIGKAVAVDYRFAPTGNDASEGMLWIEPPAAAATPVPVSTSPPSTTLAPPASAPENDLLSIPGFKTRLEAYLKDRRTRVEGLAAQYSRGLEARLGQAADGGDLALATAYRDEKARVETLQKSLAAAPTDLLGAVAESSTLPELPADAPAALGDLRKTWKTERQKIHNDLDGKLSQSLQTLVTDLTKSREFDKAKAVESYQKVFAKSPDSERGAAANSPPTPAIPAPTTGGADTETAGATKEAPFVNTLGMKFVPVPDTEVIFCIHETRYQDYSAFAKATGNVSSKWKEQTVDGCAITDRNGEHPVFNVNWNDAQQFCQWLSQKEGRTYRLPTDREWSIAVGLGRREEWEEGVTPVMLRGKVKGEYPWGTRWPPPKASGNYSDESRKAKTTIPLADDETLEGIDDGWPTTAPVMSFDSNKFGLYDMGGNVWEWVENQSAPSSKDHVMRGASWLSSRSSFMLSSERQFNPNGISSGFGFRIVLEKAPPPSMPTVPNA
ncbi:MAG: SUMF1/EgtB/PvdO family nonheme iron enzyme, partial [Verrucomicrobiae bacterium]|nr:SUMF1/EgtB/PvdO family nonheme iron enzyme [Verrucomicrobiae bacterium]